MRNVNLLITFDRRSVGFAGAVRCAEGGLGTTARPVAPRGSGPGVEPGRPLRRHGPDEFDRAVQVGTGLGEPLHADQRPGPAYEDLRVVGLEGYRPVGVGQRPYVVVLLEMNLRPLPQRPGVPRPECDSPVQVGQALVEPPSSPRQAPRLAWADA